MDLRGDRRGLLGGAGNLYYATALWEADPVPIPSFADGLWLAVYPFLYAGVVLLTRARVGRSSRHLALDATMAALVVGALAAAVVLQPVLADLAEDRVRAAVNVAYPVADLVLLAMATAALALGGWRPGRSWVLLAAGFIVFGISDVVYLVRTAGDTWQQGSMWEASWPTAFLLIAASAWITPRRVTARDLSEGRVAVVPLVFAVIGIALLVVDRIVSLNVVVTTLATAALLVVVARLAVTFAHNARLLQASRHEASTDSLTGLGGRRRLMDDLDDAAAAAGEHPAVLVLLDLNGFKAFNDREGHLAGDELLVRVAGRLRDAVAPHGRAYRLGGDEFCVLATDVDPAALRATAVGALTLVDPAAPITAAAGVARMPEEATDRRLALKLADERMYVDKRLAAAGDAEATAAPEPLDLRPDEG